IKEAVEIAVSSMTAEAHYMGVCRFSDHVYDIGRALKQPLLSALSQELLMNEKYLNFRAAFLILTTGKKPKDEDLDSDEDEEKPSRSDQMKKVLMTYFKVSEESVQHIKDKIKNREYLRDGNRGQFRHIINGEYFSKILIEENLFTSFVEET